MSGWQDTNGKFREPEHYSHTRILLEKNVWYSMFKSSHKYRMFIGFTSNYEVPSIVIDCGYREINFIKISPIIENIISCSQVETPLSTMPLPKSGKGGFLSHIQIVADEITRIKKERIETHVKKQPNLMQEQPIIEKKNKRSYKKRGSNKQLIEPTIFATSMPSPDETVADYDEQKYFARQDAQHMNGTSNGGSNGEGAEEVEEIAIIQEEDIIVPPDEVRYEPIERKKFEMKQSDFDDLVMSLQFKLPSLGKSGLIADFDLRLIVYNPQTDKSKPSFPDYKVTFGKFFKENMLNFSTLLFSKTKINEEDRIVLLFDNYFWRSSEALITLPTRGGKDSKKMNHDVTIKKCGKSLVDTGELKINQAIGWTTEYKWNVLVFDMGKGSVDNNKNMYLIDERHRTYKGLDDIDAKPSTH